jgi:hypothetical protein
MSDDISSGIMNFMQNTDRSFDDVMKFVNLLYDDTVAVYPWMNSIISKILKSDKAKAFFEFANRQNTHIARDVLYRYYLDATVDVYYTNGNTHVIINGKEL